MIIEKNLLEISKRGIPSLAKSHDLLVLLKKKKTVKCLKKTWNYLMIQKFLSYVHNQKN